MLIDFNNMDSAMIPNMNGGDGSVVAKMTVNEIGRFIFCRIPVGASIGKHLQNTNDDINYVISGTGIAVCDGKEEALVPGVCHICPKGSEHSIINTGTEDLVIFTTVPALKTE